MGVCDRARCPCCLRQRDQERGFHHNTAVLAWLGHNHGNIDEYRSRFERRRFASNDRASGFNDDFHHGGAGSDNRRLNVHNTRVADGPLHDYQDEKRE
jgi:hypothetical protein